MIRTLHPAASAELARMTDNRGRRTPLARTRRDIIEAFDAEQAADAPLELTTMPDWSAAFNWRLLLSFGLLVAFWALLLRIPS